MINTKRLYNELLNNSKITTLVDEDSIFDAYPDNVETFPCIIFLDGNQYDTEFADNKPTANSCSVDIHIFSKAISGYPTTSEIAEKIYNIFNEDYFTCTTNMDVADGEKDVRHRLLSFKKVILS